MRRADFVRALLALAGSASATAANANTKTLLDPRRLTLVDQRGSHFSLASLAGIPTLVTFTATRCTDTCPIVDGIFARIAADQRKRTKLAVQLVTITLDPKFDTPFVMSQRAAALGALPPKWRYAGGDPRAIATLLGALGVTTERDARGIPEAHSSFVYLLDRHARLARSFLLSNDLPREVDAALATMSPAVSRPARA